VIPRRKYIKHFADADLIIYIFVAFRLGIIVFRNIFFSAAKEEIIKIAKTNINKDLRFDSKKTPVEAMFKQLENK